MEIAEALPEAVDIADDSEGDAIQEEVAAPLDAEAEGAPPDDQVEMGAVAEAPAVEEVIAEGGRGGRLTCLHLQST